MPKLLFVFLIVLSSFKALASEEALPDAPPVPNSVSLSEDEGATADKNLPSASSDQTSQTTEKKDRSEETVVQSSTDSGAESLSDDVALPAVEAEPGNPSVDCTSMFLEMIKSQPAKEQEKYMDDYFSLINGYQYRSDKMDEFAWKEKEPQYKKLYAATLTEKTVYEIFSLVKLGKYDFKKKGFPVEVATDKTGLLKTFYRTSIGLVMFGGRLLGGEILCSNMGMTKHTPNQLYVRLPNLQKFKFINISEEIAKGITSQLGESRLAYATFTVGIDKIKSSQQDKLRLGIKNMVYDVTATAQKVKLTVEEELVGEFTF